MIASASTDVQVEDRTWWRSAVVVGLQWPIPPYLTGRESRSRRDVGWSGVTLSRAGRKDEEMASLMGAKAFWMPSVTRCR